jgi:polyhydroxybutyrate depolymerase
MHSKLLLFVITAFLILTLFGCAAPETMITASGSSASQLPDALNDVSAPDKYGYCTCDYNGVKRKYILYIPEGTGKNIPLVIMMHGYAGNSKSFMEDTGMNSAADKYGFAVVYPQGIRNQNSTGGACWNSGLTSSGNDDTGFLVALAKYLQQTYGLSAGETFAAGLSNGAFMSYKLACDAPQTFRAVASVAGTMSAGAWDERPVSASIGILQINGTEDGAVSVDGSMSKSGGFGNSPNIKGIIEYWKNANNLSGLNVVKLSEKATAYEYSGKENDNIVWYIEIEGGSHEWPQESTLGLSTSEVILGFFSHYVK